MHPSAENHTPGAWPSSYAHNWSAEATDGPLRVHGRHFVDGFGRVCNVRGVNISGNCKAPVNHDHDTFPHKHDEVTFVGRPFPLEEAHEHFSRLRRWGLTFIRFLVTWEAVEHAGPGIYDLEYLDYLERLLSLLPQYGIVAYVSVHQDVWSRYSGGSGAPAWTLDAVGFDLHKLEESGAAWLLGVKGGGHVEAERGLWPCGYQKLAAATMATCFWAGDTFVPKVRIKNQHGEEVSVQTFLQDAFLNMYEVVVKKVGHLEGVAGFQMMNEPHRGYIELPSLHGFDYNTDLHLSYVPSAFQSFMLGSGYPTSVAHWTRSFPMPTRRTSYSVLNPAGHKAWRKDGPTGGRCIWEMHGVWGYDTNKKTGVVLRENYFTKHPMNGKKIDWYTDYYFPLLDKWSKRVRALSHPHKLVFAEPIPNEFCTPLWTAEHRPENMVFAPHWYDLNALFSKAFGDFTVNVQGLSRGMFPLKAFYWGQKGARANYFLQIRNIVEAGYKALGETPVLMGECGVPMDMNHKEAFKTDDWTWQGRMMDAMITGLERSLIGFTLWNYNPDNDDKRGDDWNGENFSWFSRQRALPSSMLSYEQDSASLDNGGRILDSVVRPYPAKTCGIPVRFEYEMLTGEFTYEWVVPSQGKATEESGLPSNKLPSTSSPPLQGHPHITTYETEVFVPSSITHGRKILIQGVEAPNSYTYDESRQTLFIVTKDQTPGKRYQIHVSLDPPLRPAFDLNDLWTDYGSRMIFVLVVLLGFFFYRF
ncbi:hypothetical protein CCMSSC00406_0006091 [Pleurotus cornucopiae]|uniref:Uncharacterized protein n=1 Tax=Pleurotus cornucopiae TaxID=5321 RepID=A0ACB7J9F1_PLECO|nr:hypothetical protein CCMSSC00406_0006091 [Pleurotus cornucopiae]